MKSKGKTGSVARRARREFSDEFKAEAVRLAAERRAVGGSLTQVGRELDVRPDQLREWTRQQARAYGAGSGLPGETVEVLMARVRIIHAESDETYGAPRVHRELQAVGLPASPKRVARLMRAEGLVARPRKARRICTTDSNHDHPIAPNLLARQFDVHGVALNRVWVADITYIPTREGVLYLATVLDLGARRCVGWAMRETMEVELALSALRMARAARHPG